MADKDGRRERAKEISVSARLDNDYDDDDVTRKEGERWLASIEDSMDGAIQGLGEYINKSKERLIATVCSSNNNRKIKSFKSRKQKSKEKQLYGYFKRQTLEIVH